MEFPLKLNYIKSVCCRWGVYPISVAAHPQKPVQFAVGLLDGSVYVFEPRMPGGDWIKNH